MPDVSVQLVVCDGVYAFLGVKKAKAHEVVSGFIKLAFIGKSAFILSGLFVLNRSFGVNAFFDFMLIFVNAQLPIA